MKYKLIFGILFFVLLVGFCDAKGTKNLFVADRKIACAGTFECIQIREKAKAPWRIYSDTIEEFNYEEGYEYKLTVEPLQTLNTLSGLYEEKYKLLKVVSKKKTNYNPGEKLAEKKWVIKSMNDTEKTLGISDTSLFLQFDFKTGKARGKAVCNTFTMSFTVKGPKISFTDRASTKMMCRGQAFENIIFDFYRDFTTYKIQGNVLTISEPNGSNMMFEGR